MVHPQLCCRIVDDLVADMGRITVVCQQDPFLGFAHAQQVRLFAELQAVGLLFFAPGVIAPALQGLDIAAPILCPFFGIQAHSAGLFVSLALMDVVHGAGNGVDVHGSDIFRFQNSQGKMVQLSPCFISKVQFCVYGQPFTGHAFFRFHAVDIDGIAGIGIEPGLVRLRIGRQEQIHPVFPGAPAADLFDTAVRRDLQGDLHRAIPGSRHQAAYRRQQYKQHRQQVDPSFLHIIS